MKLLKLSIGMFALLLFSFSAISCEETKKEEKAAQKMEMKGDDGHDHEHDESTSNENHDMDMSKMESTSGDVQKSSKSDAIVAGYLQLKNALVADNSKEAAVAAGNILNAFKGFDTSGYTADQQKELGEILENANEQAEHIVKNVKNMHHQREHLDVLSNDMIDFLAIVGTEKTLYQTHCPMFGKKGATWISETKEIKNPFMGSKMPTCGKVQKEL